MHPLYFSHEDVVEKLPMSQCIELMRGTFGQLASGSVTQPLRSLVRGRDASGFLGLMPAHRPGEYGLKAVCVFPGNPARGLETHLGVVLLFSGETGELLAMADASAITAIRTAAVSALATQLLAREDAKVLAVIGTGTQARMHVESIPLVRDIEEIRVAGRTRERAEQFAAESKAPVVVGEIEEIVRGADIVVTATSSKEPVLPREWISPGTHINAVGACVATARELDSALVADASLFVDLRHSADHEAGDYLIPLKEGVITDKHIRAELGEIVGAKTARRSSDEITIFKSLGLAIEDLACISFLWASSRQ